MQSMCSQAISIYIYISEKANHLQRSKLICYFFKEIPMSPQSSSCPGFHHLHLSQNSAKSYLIRRNRDVHRLGIALDFSLETSSVRNTCGMKVCVFCYRSLLKSYPLHKHGTNAASLSETSFIALIDMCLSSSPSK